MHKALVVGIQAGAILLLVAVPASAVQQLGMAVYLSNGTAYTLAWSTSNIGQTAQALAFRGGDVNNDSKMDIVQIRDAGGKAELVTYLSNGTGYSATTPSTLTHGSSALSERTGDVDGNNSLDFIRPYNNGGRLGLKVVRSVNGLFSNLTKWSNSDMGQGSGALAWLVGDMNLDGKADLIQPWKNGSRLGLIAYTSNGIGYTFAWGRPNMGQGAGALRWLTGDMNGDGRIDIIQPWDNNGRLGLIVYTSTGTSFTYAWATQNIGQGSSALTWLTGDVNGDGKTDIIQPFKSASNLGFIVYKSTGVAYSYLWGTNNISGATNNLAWFARDVDGDGKVDVIKVRRTGDGKLGVAVYRSTGTALQLSWSTQNLDASASNVAFLAGDVNGDGKADLVRLFKN